VCCTFPCLFTLVNEVLCDSLSQDQLSNIPIVQGFLYEDHFFSAFVRTAYFKIKTTDGYASFSFTDSLTVESGVGVEIGPLYHTYPVIDGVG